MDWLEFISTIIKSAIWPVILLVIVLILKKPVANIINAIAELKLESLQYGELKAQFNQGLAKVASELEASQSNETLEENNTDHQKVEVEEEQQKNSFSSITHFGSGMVIKMASEAPNLGVALSWARLVEELESTIIRLDIKPKEINLARDNAQKQMKYLVSNGYLENAYYEAFKELNYLKEIALNNNRKNGLTYLQYRQYSDLISKITSALRDLQK
ncbi:hypothetical protein MOC47_05655 [Bacillus spizizenii]|uniref:Uncharacterized protein n=1 Tax=Bacillus spizizenii TaxID=96241 RepID=A0A9Q4DQT9_BACSC|nr:hypothetical protein [Bacillus spizizenii]MCY8065064.1 hypothetical protein [Bacillus spizizenii]MCY8121958.1 hypothetical protein [Bacillus spizizenii]MCY8328330.1 hypothetical protein [Bacillus spizizenii]MCY8333247.1 hypothetical protein [Bacillus spizizenii]MCY9368404.1 hypothetical protein [Bacillus spizizenii]